MTIKEAYSVLDGGKRRQLLLAIARDGVAYSTAYAWCSGSRNPKLLYRNRIARHLNSIAGTKYTPGELFPEDSGCKSEGMS